jgi:hypothetical protein
MNMTISINESPRSEFVHISTIGPGDTVRHAGVIRTVTRTNIRRDEFMGRSLFGDSYMLGLVKVERLVYPKAILNRNG